MDLERNGKAEKQNRSFFYQLEPRFLMCALSAILMYCDNERSSESAN